MVTRGIDRSHWNAEPDYAALKAGGHLFVLCKGTDGRGYKDPTYEPCRAGAEAAGLVFGGYHFAEWGDPTVEANYFLSQCSPRPGELVALDCEAAIPAGVDVVAWAVAWSKIIHAATGAWPLAYMNQSWLSAHNWAPLANLGDGLWLAKYDGLPTGGAIGPWPVLAMKQFTDAAVVPGESGAIDEDAFQGDLATLLKYAVPTPPPAPAPAPTPPTQDGFDMGYSQWAQADKDALLNDINTKIWTTPVQPPNGIDNRGTPDTTWPLDRIRGTDYKTGLLTSQPPLDPAAVANAIAGNADLVAKIGQAAAAAVTADLVGQVIAAMDTDLAHRFGTP